MARVRVMCLCVYGKKVYRGRVLYRVEKKKIFIQDSGPQNNGLSHLFPLSFVSGASAEGKVSSSLCLEPSILFSYFILASHFVAPIGSFAILSCSLNNKKRHLKMLRCLFQEVQMFNNPLGSVMTWREKRETADRTRGGGQRLKAMIEFSFQIIGIVFASLFDLFSKTS